MRGEEPEPERDEITERVQRLEKRLSQFEQQLRSFPQPPAETQATDAAAASLAPGNDTTQEQDSHAKAPEPCHPLGTGGTKAR
jgi:hypothetical protein